jgi:GDPmannose 4,6-dehydratase
MNKKTICISGINGQLGQYLAKFLIENEPALQIIGTLRHKTSRHETYIFDASQVIFELMDLNDAHSIENLIVKYKPDYFINCAACAFVAESWATYEVHMQQNFMAVLHQLEAIRKYSPNTRYYNSGSSEEFGVKEVTAAQNESTIISPRSPYGVSKSASRFGCKVWRESYSLYAIQGWSFNFESPLRDEKYFPRKISKGVARIHYATSKGHFFNPIEVGNLNSHRSFLHAKDVAFGIWLQLNQEKYNKNYPISACNNIDLSKKYFINSLKEYVISSNDTFPIRNLIELAFMAAGISGYWEGEGLNEKFLSTSFCDESGNPSKLVIINEKFFRPNDVTYLHGDSSAIKKDLGWKQTVQFKDLIFEMVSSDIKNFTP